MYLSLRKAPVGEGRNLFELFVKHFRISIDDWMREQKEEEEEEEQEEKDEGGQEERTMAGEGSKLRQETTAFCLYDFVCVCVFVGAAKDFFVVSMVLQEKCEIEFLFQQKKKKKCASFSVIISYNILQVQLNYSVQFVKRKKRRNKAVSSFFFLISF